MFKFLNCVVYFCIILLFWNCATGPSSVEFTSAKTKARSERNLKDAEKYALEALNSEVHQNDAQVPYFLAMEIYKPQKKWHLVYEMLQEAIKRDPEAMLERRFMYNDEVVVKMKDAINIQLIELWVPFYNDALAAYNNDEIEKSIELLLVSLELDSTKLKSYIMLSKVYNLNKQSDLAQQLIEQALSFNDITKEEKAELYLVRADMLNDAGDYDGAIDAYNSAYLMTGSIYSMIELLNLNLKAENYFKALEWGNTVYEEFYQIDDAFRPSVLFNIGLAYRYVAAHYYDLGVDVIDKINANELPSRAELEECKNNFKVALEHFDMSRDYFLESHDEYTADEEDPDDTDASIRADQTRDYMKLIKKDYIPFIEQKIATKSLEK